MDVFISGVAGRAVFSQGAESYFIDLEYPESKVAVSDSGLSEFAIFRALGSTSDIQCVKVESEDDGFAALVSASDKDDALRLFEIALDFVNYPEISEAALNELELLLGCNEIHDFVRNYAFAVPNCHDLCGHELPSFLQPENTSSQLVREVIAAQPAISNARKAWDIVSKEHFFSSSELSAAELHVVETGGFYCVCNAVLGKVSGPTAKFELLVALAGLAAHRELIQAWFEVLELPSSDRDPKVDFDLSAVAKNDEKYAEEDMPKQNFTTEDEVAKYSEVKAVKDAILYRLQEGDLNKAREFEVQIVAKQVASGDFEFAAKTLCSLAQEAKFYGYASLYLEWTLKAVEVCPHDPWTHAQAGDAFIALYRYDKATEYFNDAAAFGDPHYGGLGIARIALHTQQFEEAEAGFRKLKNEFPDHPDAIGAWLGLGDTLRRSGRSVDALAIYRQTAEKFSTEYEPLCKVASINAANGLLKEAIEIYERVLDEFGEPLRAMIGYGHALRSAGSYQKSIDIFEKAASKYPHESEPFLGKARSLRKLGDYKEALAVFEAARVKFDYEPRAHFGFALVLSDLGNLADSLKEFDSAIAKFPNEARLQNGKARTLQLTGSYTDALQAFDQVCRQFPYNLNAHVGRIQILKELGELDSALSAVRELAKRHPESIYVANSFASVHTLRGEFDEALEALQVSDTPQTKNEWAAHHIGCMIDLKRGNARVAKERLAIGLRKNPFSDSRAFYQNSLAVAHMIQQEHQIALEAAKVGVGAAAELVKLHSYVALGQSDMAKDSLDKLQNDPRSNIVSIAYEFGRKAGIANVKPANDLHSNAYKHIGFTIADVALATAA